MCSGDFLRILTRIQPIPVAPFKVPSVSNGSFQNVPMFGNDLMTAPQWRWQLSTIDRRLIESLENDMDELPSETHLWEKKLQSHRSQLTLKLCVHMAYQTLAEQCRISGSCSIPACLLGFSSQKGGSAARPRDPPLSNPASGIPEGRRRLNLDHSSESGSNVTLTSTCFGLYFLFSSRFLATSEPSSSSCHKVQNPIATIRPYLLSINPHVAQGVSPHM